MSPALAAASISASTFWPSSPTSLPPAEMMMAPGTFGLAAFLHDLRHPQDGDGDDGQVDGRPHRGDRGIGFQPQDLPVFGVNGVDVSLEAVPFQVVHQGVADAALFGAGSHYRDGLRLKKLLENMSFHPALRLSTSDQSVPCGCWLQDAWPKGLRSTPRNRR